MKKFLDFFFHTVYYVHRQFIFVDKQSALMIDLLFLTCFLFL